MNTVCASASGASYAWSSATPFAGPCRADAGSLETIGRFSGDRPLGWLGPGLTQTEEPTTIATVQGKLAALLYPVELTESPVMLVQHQESDHLLRRTIQQLDRF